MRLNFAILAQDVRILDNGGLEIVDPITDLSANDLPAIHSEAAVVVNFVPGDAEEHELGLKVTSGYQNDCIEPYVQKLNPAKSDTASIGHVVYLRDVALEKVGDYRVEVAVDGETLITLPFTLRLKECPTCEEK
ncbi:MAG: hypothetical protein WC565_01180 [Parcubacteria group bacterium]